jgi:proteasome lid subunit RPN8/RPN11
MSLRISSPLLARLLAEAAAAPEQEVCGLLLGTADAITEAVAAPNVAADPRTAFELDPATLLAALRRERAGGAAVIGHYHSHPNGSTRPSPRDAAACGRPGHVWLILADGRAALWRERPGGAVEGAFDPLTLDAV